MIQKLWVEENRRHLVCVDSYEGGILRGRFFSSFHEMESFESLSQFLIRLEQMLDDLQTPQSYTEARTFSSLLEAGRQEQGNSSLRRGKQATFELQVLFRQHSSWQGVLIWRETGLEHSFRSVLELVILMDSALRTPERRDSA